MRSQMMVPLGALETRQEIAAGRLTAEAATEQLLERIADLEPDVEAWVAVDTDGARAAAKALDQGPDRGALHGVSLGAKDIFAAKNLPWRCGSPIWKDRVADFDAPSVALARRAGSVILGKTETTEFAGYKPTRTKNPAAPGRTPGGSSSGSAAAVACGMAPLAFGTQTSGSIIRPASFCGVVGFKPSFDTLDTSGVAPLSRSFDTLGFFARSVPDIAFAMDALSGLDFSAALAVDSKPFPFGLFRSAAWGRAEAQMIDVWERFEGDLAGFGSGLTDPLPKALVRDWDGALDLHARLMAVEASEALAHEAALAPELLSSGLLEQIEEGRAMPAKQRAADRQAFREMRAKVLDQLAPDAVWVTPSACGAAPDFAAGTGDPAFNRTWSLLGLPACSIPLLQDEDGRPIGVQIVGSMGNDAGVLALAHALMTRMLG